MTTIIINKKSDENVLSIHLLDALSISINADLIETAIDDFKKIIKMLITTSGGEIDHKAFEGEEFHLLITQLVSLIKSTDYMKATINIDDKFNMYYQTTYAASINIKEKLDFLKQMFNV
jgi:hypothetical protein